MHPNSKSVPASWLRSSFSLAALPCRLWHRGVLASLASMTPLFIIRFYSPGPAGLALHWIQLLSSHPGVHFHTIFCSAASSASVLLDEFSRWLPDCDYASECSPALHLKYSPWHSWRRLSKCPLSRSCSLSYESLISSYYKTQYC